MSTGMDLKVLRITRRIKQREVAERAGLSRSWVAKVEHSRGHLAAVHVDRYLTALLTFDTGLTNQPEPDAQTEVA